jgi:CheY-like chemotaxis protein
VGFAKKPLDESFVGALFDRLVEVIDSPYGRVLLIEDDGRERAHLAELVGGTGVEVVPVDTPNAVGPALREGSFACLVVSHTAEQVLWSALGEETPGCPVVIYGNEVPREEAGGFSAPPPGVVVRRARTPDLVLDATTLFLHQRDESLPNPKRKLLRGVCRRDPNLIGKSVLVVDDDVRNVFSIVAVLEPHEIRVACAENGLQALEKLQQNQFDLVLMDIMMPLMDGYEATRRIRGDLARTELPVIALTAKAMAGDREKCIDAGASDYVMKPVDPDQLVSVLRVWLQRRPGARASVS